MIFDGETLCEEHYALKHIGVDSEVLNYCALCMEVPYCGRIHQKEHWKMHKKGLLRAEKVDV